MRVFVTADTSHPPSFISGQRAPRADTIPSTSHTTNIPETPHLTKRNSRRRLDTGAPPVKTRDMEFPTNLNTAAGDEDVVTPQAEPEPSKKRGSKKRKNDDDDDDDYVDESSNDEASEPDEDTEMGSGGSETESGRGSGGSGLVESEDEVSEEQAAINSPPKKEARPTSSVSVEVARFLGYWLK